LGHFELGERVTELQIIPAVAASAAFCTAGVPPALGSLEKLARRELNRSSYLLN
jgi:hypothetical protein